LHRLLKSELFTFLIGEGKTPFIVHAGAIASQSDTLDTMINGEFVEKHTRSATLEEVDEDTFARFCQFAYTGDYHPPESETDKKDAPKEEVNDCSRCDITHSSSLKNERPAEASAAEEAEPIEESERPKARRVTKRKKGKVNLDSEYDSEERRLSKEARVRKAFKNRDYDTTQSREAMIEECMPVENDSPDEIYLPVFLGHAKLYVFADKYDIPPLKVLALNKLHKTLLTFTLYDKRVGDIVGLVKFTYENTSDMRVTDQLRQLVVHYVVYELDTISDKKKFYRLLGEGGDFVRDFWRMVKRDVL
jgi:hypothetical protein